MLNSRACARLSMRYILHHNTSYDYKTGYGDRITTGEGKFVRHALSRNSKLFM